MLHPELLALLVCPETHRNVAEADSSALAVLNEAIQQGQLRTVADKVVTQSIDGALIRDDRAVAYPVRDDIPVMLVAEGLAISKLNLSVAPKA